MKEEEIQAIKDHEKRLEHLANQGMIKRRIYRVTVLIPASVNVATYAASTWA